MVRVAIVDQAATSLAQFGLLLAASIFLSHDAVAILSIALMAALFMSGALKAVFLVPFSVAAVGSPSGVEALYRHLLPSYRRGTYALAAAMVLIAAAMVLFGGPAILTLGLLAGSTTVIFTAANECLVKYCYQQGAAQVPLRASIVQVVCLVAIIPLFVRLRGDACVLALPLLAAVRALALSWGVASIRRRYADDPAAAVAPATSLASSGLLGAHFLVAAYSSLPLLLAPFFLGAAQIASFSLARSFVQQPINVLLAASENSDRPRLARALAELGAQGALRTAGRIASRLLLLALPATLLPAAATWGINLVGRKYQFSLLLLALMVGGGLTMALGHPFYSLLLATRRRAMALLPPLAGALCFVCLLPLAWHLSSLSLFACAAVAPLTAAAVCAVVLASRLPARTAQVRMEAVGC